MFVFALIPVSGLLKLPKDYFVLQIETGQTLRSGSASWGGPGPWRCSVCCWVPVVAASSRHPCCEPCGRHRAGGRATAGGGEASPGAGAGLRRRATPAAPLGTAWRSSGARHPPSCRQNPRSARVSRRALRLKQTFILNILEVKNTLYNKHYFTLFQALTCLLY